MGRKTPSNGLEEFKKNADWRKGFQNKKITEKWRLALDNEIYTDILLYVGPEREEIKCHRLVLKLQSEKLAELVSNDDDEYELDNFNPKIFRKFLTYLYTDALLMNGEEAIQLMHIAHRFEILELSKKCREKVQNDINIDNAAFILEQAKLLSDNDLSNKTQEFILRNAEEVFKTNGFEELSINSVLELVKSKEKNINEINAFEAVRRWAISECDNRQGVEATGENVYSAAESLFELIDFSQFSPAEFGKHVVQTKSLPESLLLQKLMELTLANSEKTMKPTPASRQKTSKPEKVSKPENAFVESSKSELRPKYSLQRYGTIVSENWPDNGKGKHKVSFKINHPVWIEGVELFAWQNEEEKEQEITVILTDYDEGVTFATITTNCALPPPKTFIKVHFPEAYQTAVDTWYTITVLVKGTLSAFGAGGKKKYSVPCDGKQVTFELKASQVEGSSHLRGQIPIICFSLP